MMRSPHTKRWVKKLRALSMRQQLVVGVEEVDPRIERYETIAAGEIIGYQMPWKEYTDVTLGWKGGEYGLISARTGVGKTFLAILHGHSVWHGGKPCSLYFDGGSAKDLAYSSRRFYIVRAPRCIVAGQAKSQARGPISKSYGGDA